MAAEDHPGDRAQIGTFLLASYAQLDAADDHLERLRGLAAKDPPVTEAAMVDGAIEHVGGFMLSLVRAGVYALADIGVSVTSRSTERSGGFGGPM